MIIAYLAPANSIHTVRWCNAMANLGHEIHLISMHEKHAELSEKIFPHPLKYSAPLGYFLNSHQLKKILDIIHPDIFHAHFASGYGTLGRKAAFHPYVLSVWGSDVYDFPRKSSLHTRLLMKNLAAPDIICSTSTVMRKQTQTLAPTNKPIRVIPFGVDTELFKPSEGNSGIEKRITIGTVKTMAPKYGIDTLIKAFALLIQDPEMSREDVNLVLVGGGPDLEKLKRLSKELQIITSTSFLGQVDHQRVPELLRNMDIYIAPSRLDSESFGVAVIEASSSGIPVIVSDVGGLVEVVENQVTGIIVPKDDVGSVKEAMKRLVVNPDLRKGMGKKGRERVLKLYDWKENVNAMEEIYIYLLSKNAH
ncbi:MAG: glycosyltransferase [Synergistales bacterium]|nr:glycosyltransferase [Synergistales bacterium]